ncbi:MAG: fasciclin domain-containing protein, partial [Bacteroidota bacterium]
QFQLNSANSQGGAIWTNRISMDVVNSEFYQNIVTADNDDMLGIGGAIGLNGDSAYVVEFNIANNTFIGNLATTEGDQIALFQSTDNPTDITETNLFLANNAFFSFDPDSEAGQVVIENESNGSITSNGGNFFNASVDDFTLDATDIFDEAAFEGDFFVEAEEFDRPLIDLTPLLGTALVDGGVVTSETPTTDRIGLPRDMSPDIGSREIQGTVVDVAVNSGIHNTLVSVLGTAGLVTTLQGDGPFNVFAPTDDAFAAVPDTVLQRIVGDIQNCLTPTLTYHVVGEATDDGIVLSPEIVDGDVETAPTLQGETLGLEANSDLVVEVTHFAGVSNVILANLIANNGVVHVIDEVMVPEAVVNTCLNPNSVEDLQASGIDLTIFPNPVVEELQINALDASIRDFEVSLIDSYGRFLSTYQFGNGSHDIDMSGLPTGNYTLLFIVEGEMYSTQIIKQ